VLSRILAIAFGVVAAALVAWLVASRWGEPEATVRVPASEALTDGFIEALCRPPQDVETIKWDSRPIEKPKLLEALKDTTEGQRVLQIRRIYLNVLIRDPLDGDCAGLREWVDRPVSMEEVRDRLAESPEARRVAQVRQTLVETLGRDPAGPDNATLRRWVDSGSTPGEIRAQLAQQRPQVGVHYFTWYKVDDGRWGNGATPIQAGAPRPSLGWYTSSNVDVIDTHIGQMAGAGFDFVIVQIVTHSPASWETAHRFFGRLLLRGRNLRAAVMLDGLNTETRAVKTKWVEKARAEFTRHANYFSLYGEPLMMLYSARLDFAVPGTVLRNVYWTNSYGPGANTFNLDLFLYPRDWPFWSATPQPLINGVVPVVPGYVDTHLGRAEPMEYPRDNGRMYHDQWQRALALRPEIILVYSWNEHFEQTAIEPTEAWGDRYLQWTACYIAHAHAGTTGAC
jgi:hypothetical protein